MAKRERKTVRAEACWPATFETSWKYLETQKRLKNQQNEAKVYESNTEASTTKTVWLQVNLKLVT